MLDTQREGKEEIQTGYKEKNVSNEGDEALHRLQERWWCHIPVDTQGQEMGCEH